MQRNKAINRGRDSELTNKRSVSHLLVFVFDAGSSDRIILFSELVSTFGEALLRWNLSESQPFLKLLDHLTVATIPTHNG